VPRIGWTGQRPDLFADAGAARATVQSVAQRLSAAHGPVDLQFVAGGQRGVDTWAAEAAIDLGIAFEMILPLARAAFAADWSAADRDRLMHLLSLAACVEVVGGETDAAYTERNRRVARVADRLVAVWTGVGAGGTAETIHLARGLGKPVDEHVLPAAPGAPNAVGRGR
jgi:hypothetical protein